MMTNMKKKMIPTTKKNEANNYEYDKMDENKLANILQDPNNFQVTHETEEEQDFFKILIFDRSPCPVMCE